VAWVVTVDKHHFDIMLQSDTGRFLLILAVFLQVVGMFLIRKFSIIKSLIAMIIILLIIIAAV